MATIPKDELANRSRTEEPTLPAPPEDAPPLHALIVPYDLVAVLPCPSCGDRVTTKAHLFVRVTKDSDGQGALTLRTRAAKVAHVCGQMTLGEAIEGPRTR